MLAMLRLIEENVKTAAAECSELSAQVRVWSCGHMVFSEGTGGSSWADASVLGSLTSFAPCFSL